MASPAQSVSAIAAASEIFEAGNRIVPRKTADGLQDRERSRAAVRALSRADVLSNTGSSEALDFADQLARRVQ